MEKLFFRTATAMDMEMLACEVGKIEAAEAWREDRRGQPSKGYFKVERDWGDWKQNLQTVPLCTLAPGESPGGKLETRCVDLRPRRLERI